MKNSLTSSQVYRRSRYEWSGPAVTQLDTFRLHNQDVNHAVNTDTRKMGRISVAAK